MAAPTRVSFTASTDTNVLATTGKTTANIAVLTGDFIVIAGGCEDGGTGGLNPGTLTISLTGGLTSAVTTVQSDNQTGYSSCSIGWANVTGGGNIQGKLVGTSANIPHMVVGVWVYRNHGGIGQTGKSHQAATTAPSLTLNGCLANSAIAALVTDWSAQSGARTYTQINGANPTEGQHFGDGAAWHYDFFDYADTGAAGNQTLGESAPASQTPNLLAIEVLALSGTGPPRAFNPIPFM